MSAEKPSQESNILGSEENRSQNSDSSHAAPPTPALQGEINNKEILSTVHRSEKRSAYNTANLLKKRKSDDEKHEASRKRTKEILESMEERLEYLEQLFSAFIKGKSNAVSSAAGTSSNEKGSQQYRSPLKNCMFCKGNHWASECNEFPTLTSRRQRALELNKCERCLFAADHLVTACTSQALCYYCKNAKRGSEMGKHHTAFCSFHFKM